MYQQHHNVTVSPQFQIENSSNRLPQKITRALIFASELRIFLMHFAFLSSIPLLSMLHLFRISDEYIAIIGYGLYIAHAVLKKNYVKLHPALWFWGASYAYPALIGLIRGNLCDIMNPVAILLSGIAWMGILPHKIRDDSQRRWALLLSGLLAICNVFFSMERHNRTIWTDSRSGMNAMGLGAAFALSCFVYFGSKLLLLAGFSGCGMLIVGSGSRNAFFGSLIGCGGYLLLRFYRSASYQKGKGVFQIIIVAILIVMLSNELLNTSQQQHINKRYERIVSHAGDFSTREDAFLWWWEYNLQEPILGHGYDKGHNYWLYVSRAPAPHSKFLQIMTLGGFISLGFFLIACWKMLCYFWKLSTTAEIGAIAVAVFAQLLLCMAVEVRGLEVISTWLYLPATMIVGIGLSRQPTQLS